MSKARVGRAPGWAMMEEVQSKLPSGLAPGGELVGQGAGILNG